jgi:dolichol-phosphate mannosyltransferase
MRTLILIPTYNEAQNINRLFEAIGKEIFADILVIDDNSPDGTGKLADKLAENDSRLKVLHRPKKEGLGKAYLAGYKYALENNYTEIVQLDADLSHDPRYLRELLDNLQNADVVIGSRYCKGVSCYNWPFRRIVLSKVANALAMRMLRCKVKDLTSGYKVIKSSVLKNININSLHSSGYAFQIETVYRALRRGYIVKEVPIIFYEREDGKSKLSKTVMIEAAWLILKIFFGAYKF